MTHSGHRWLYVPSVEAGSARLPQRHLARIYLCARELELSCSSLEFGEGVMDRKSVLSAHRLANYLPIIVCGIV